MNHVRKDNWLFNAKLPSSPQGTALGIFHPCDSTWVELILPKTPISLPKPRSNLSLPRDPATQRGLNETRVELSLINAAEPSPVRTTSQCTFPTLKSQVYSSLLPLPFPSLFQSPRPKLKEANPAPKPALIPWEMLHSTVLYPAGTPLLLFIRSRRCSDGDRQ